MQPGRLITGFACGALLSTAASYAAAATASATVDFESVASATSWGGQDGNQPGDIALIQNGVTMSVEEFYHGTYVSFNRAQVGGFMASHFSTQSLTLGNINVAFDFGGLGFAVDHLTLEFADSGGINNIAVNGETLYQADPLSGAPISIAAGVTLSVIESSIQAPGLITLDGPVTSLLIGGQEFGIDNLVVTPEPAGLTLLLLSAALLRHRPRARHP